MRSRLAVVLWASASGHGSMSVPRPRNAGNSSIHPSPGEDRSCVGDACYWYQIGCFIGCDECSNDGMALYPPPSCASPMEPTNNDPETRTWDPYTQSSRGDFTKYNPWRAPGRAPVVDPCGDASGFREPAPYIEIPSGYQAFDKGAEVLPSTAPTHWTAGGTAEVGWAIAAQHGGGYSYRLCPKSRPLTEGCFQANQLRFSDKNTTIRYHDGSRPDRSIRTVDVFAEGQHWRKSPIPGCACDAGVFCHGPEDRGSRPPLGAVFAHLGDPEEIDWTPYPRRASPTADCPDGTMYEAGWEDGTNPGFLVGTSKPWSIMDEVLVPNAPGEYVLSWRWDCEGLPHVWSSCADIVIEQEVPPPSPPVPTPRPSPGPPTPSLECKSLENPTCQGSPNATRRSCWLSGCQVCDDGGSDCATCCGGCTLVVDGSRWYCDLVSEVAV